MSSPHANDGGAQRETQTYHGPAPGALTPEAWERIGEIFSEAVELEEPERGAFVEQACAANPQLRTEIVALVAHHGQAAFVDRPSPGADLLHSAVGRSGEATLKPGTVLAERYRIEALLGSGGMGEVYRALDLTSDTASEDRIALKILRPEFAADSSLRRRFQREVELARRAKHRNICPVYDAGTHGDIHFFTMQLVEGETLAQRIRRAGALDREEAFPLIVQMAKGLAAAHRAGVIHRDFKSSNVMLSPQGAVITDFGLARFEASAVAHGSDITVVGSLLSVLAPGTMTANAQVAGTVAYMSPEQLSGGEVTAASDIYSLGIVLYEMATGSLPFSDSHIIQSAMQRVSGPAPDVRAVAPALDARWSTAITRCLQRKPADRFPTADTVAEHVVPHGWRPAPFYWTRRQWSLALAGAAAAMMAIGTAWYALTRPYEPSNDARAWYEDGARAFGEGAPRKAANLLERAVKIDDRYLIAHARLAEVYSDLDQLGRAQEELARIHRMAADRARLPGNQLLMVRAAEATVARDFVGAERHYRDAASRSSTEDSPRALLDLGRAADNAGHTTEAIAAYRNAVKAPRNEAALLRLGMMLSRAGQYDEAEKRLNEAEGIFRLGSNFEGVAQTLMARARLLESTKQIDQAEQQLREALNTAALSMNVEHQIRARLELGRMRLRAGRSDEAKQLAEEAIRLGEANGAGELVISGLSNLGDTFAAQSDWPRAEDFYRSALASAVHNRALRGQARANLMLGQALLATNRHSEAQGYLNSAMQFYQTGRYSDQLLAAQALFSQAYANAGDYGQALRIAEEMRAAADGAGQIQLQATALARAAGVRWYAGDLPESLALRRQQTSLEKQSGRTAGWVLSLLNEAEALSALGDVKAARQRLDEGQRAIKTLGSGARATKGFSDYVQARILLVEGQGNAAAASAADALKTFDGDPQRQVLAYSALCIAGVSATREQACGKARSLAAQSSIPALISLAEVSIAESAVRRRSPEAAALAGQARTNALARGHREVAFHALLLKLSLRGGVKSDKEFLKESEGLRHSWGRMELAGYLTRPDIRNLLLR